MPNKHPCRRIFIATAAAATLLSFSGAGATWAFMTTAHETVSNDFTVADCKASIVERFDPPDAIAPGDQIVKEVCVRNTGSSDCFVRTLVRFEDGACKDWASIEFNEGDWQLEDDGYRYLEKELEPGETSPPVCTKVVISPEASQSQIESFNVIAFCESTPVECRDGSSNSSAQEAFAGRKDSL